VHTAEPVSDVDEPMRADALAEEAANEPPRTDVVPGDRDQ